MELTSPLAISFFSEYFSLVVHSVRRLCQVIIIVFFGKHSPGRLRLDLEHEATFSRLVLDYDRSGSDEHASAKTI